MIWPISFGVAFIFLAFGDFYGGYHTPRNFMDYCVATMLFLLFALVATLIGTGLGFLIGLLFPKKRVHLWDTELVSLRDSDGLHGSFFLGTGSIGSTEYYFYYKKVGEGFKPGKIEVDNNVTVFEKKRNDGLLKVYETRLANGLLWIFGLTSSERSFEIMIPEGSLKQNFVIQ